jgi:PGF-pre-PGF domain-containing protein
MVNISSIVFIPSTKTGNEYMTDRKKIAFIFIILLFFIPLVSANNDNIIFLKAGHIDTDLETGANVTEPDVMAVNINSEVADSSYTYYLVQFDGIVQPEWKDTVETTGAEIFDYVPDNTFVLKMNETVKSQVESLEFVRWVGEYLPEYKYDLSLETDENQMSINEIQIETIILNVFLFESQNAGEIAKAINDINGDVISSSDRILTIVLPKNQFQSLASIKGISWIEEYSEVVLFNDVAAGILNVDAVHNDIELNGSGQIIAVCDTGLDTGVDDSSMHPDFSGRIIDIIDFSGDGAADNADAWNNGGHGTHVTGSVLGNGSMSEGQYKGMAPEAELVFEAVQKTDGTMVISSTNLESIFQDAYAQGARIHTNSWGYTSNLGDYTSISRMVDEFMWQHPDMLILFSAGNLGTDSDKDGVVDINSTSPPATSKNCIAVGASENYRPEIINYTYGNSFALPISEDTKADNIDGIAAFSSRGPTDDGRIKPDLVAPGTFIASTRSSYISWYEWGLIDDNYAYMGGTSMAAPLVAGSAALVREYYTEMESVATPSAALIKATLINGAIDMTPGQYGEGTDQEITGRPDNSQGWGRVDVANSIMADYPEVTAYYDGESLSTGNSWTHTYDYIESGKPLRATLVWTDYPASASASKSLVNDLDFTIADSSDTYYGNDGSGPDRINNVEGIELSSVSDDDYTFTVDGYSVSMGGTQPFALVASFTCENNEFPAPGTQADSKNIAVSTDVVHPQGVDYDSIVMKINNSPVSFTSTPITGGYSIIYNSASSYQTGEYNVSVTASTETGQEFSYSWNFTVDAETSNTAPVLLPIGNKTVSESYPLVIELSATDADNDTLTFGTNASFGVLSGDTFTWNPGYSDAGTYDIEFNVTDNTDVDSEIITINVINLDRRPELETIGSKTVNENSTLSFTISATDADNDTVSYSANGLPDNATLDTGSGEFSWNPQYDEAGTYNVEFIASANGLSDSETIVITVLNVDRGPVLSAIGNKEVNENNLLSFIVSAADPDGPATITYSANNMPEGATFDSNTGEFSWTPLYNQSGVYDVEFIANSNGLIDSQNVSITVSNVDRAPVLGSIGSKSVSENQTLNFNISATDPDDDSVSYAVNDLPQGATFSSSGDFSWTPSYEQSGNYVVEFIASANGLQDSETITITVLNVDRPVKLDPVDDVIVNETEVIDFIVAGSDPDKDKVTYSVSVHPGNSSFDSESGNFHWVTGYNDSGSYEIEFTATANGTTDSELMTITINNVDRKPELATIGNKIVDENSTLMFTLSATDADGDDITYSASSLPDNSVFDSVSGTFEWTPLYNQSGIYDVEFIAISNGLTDSQNVSITVSNVDRAPVLKSIGSRSINENKTLTFTVSATDPDDDLISYSVAGLPPGASFTPSNAEFTWTPSYDDSKDYIVEFKASANALNDSETITITVLNVDRPVQLDPVDDVIVNETEIIDFIVTGSDPDGDKVTYSVSALPGNSTFDSESGNFHWVTGYNDSGNYYINFTAIANGLIDYENVSIRVVNVNAPPQFNTISAQTVLVNEDLRFTLNATDIDNDNLTYSADSIPEGAEFNATNLLFNWTPIQNQTGNYYANFTVNDSQYSDYLNVSITVTNTTLSAVTTSSAAGGGGGGGGGGGTTEEFENIAVKDVSSMFVGNDMDVVFEFRNAASDIHYVEYRSLKNAGSISVTVEVLVDKSALVDSLPSGIVYRNINIWVGKTGYAIEENIANPVIGFRVDRNWIENNNINPDSIVLNRYNGGWSKLSTRQTDSDANYLYFEATTPGFSPFAITGETQVIESSLNSVDSQFSPEDSEPMSNLTAQETKPENTLNAVSGLVSLLILTFVCFLHRKQ